VANIRVDDLARQARRLGAWYVDAVLSCPVQHDLTYRSVAVRVATRDGEQRVDDCANFVLVNGGAGGPPTPDVQCSASLLQIADRVGRVVDFDVRRNG
jgi:hypothetical protein